MIKDLTSGDIQKQLRSLAFPATVGYLFHTLYNVTDTYFAGVISTQALAALSISFPVFFLLLGVGIGMSEGLTAIVANTLGEGSREKAVIMSKNALIFSFVLSVIVILIGLLSSEFLMRLMGAEGEYLQSAISYVNIIILGSGFVTIGMFINSLLNAQGDMISYRNILIISFVLNIALDYGFVHLGFGVKGIAYATVITEAITMIYLFFRLKRTPLLSDGFSFDKSFYFRVLKQGIPPTANMIFMALGVFVITYYASIYGKEIVAMLGIGMRIEQLAIMPIVGINVAVLAMVSQNSGAKKYSRIHKIIKVSLIDSLYISIAAFIVLTVFPVELMSFFSDDLKVINEGVVFLHVEAFIMFAFAVLFIYVAILQGIEKPKFIFYLSIIRQIILPVILLEIITHFSDNILYIWLAIAFSVVMGAIVVWRYASYELRKKKLKEYEL
jgi:putative MATE family efflux protein